MTAIHSVTPTDHTKLSALVTGSFLSLPNDHTEFPYGLAHSCLPLLLFFLLEQCQWGYPSISGLGCVICRVRDEALL